MKVIKTPEFELSVDTEKGKHGQVLCTLEGGISYERSLFLDTLEEIFDPPQNPRYILLRKSFLWRWMRKDFHAVPQIIEKNKANAKFFNWKWRKYVGPAQLIYTRSLKGRKWLLQARAKSLSSAFQHWSNRISRWK